MTSLGKWLSGLTFLVSACPAVLHAQAFPAASAAGILQVGGTASFARSNYLPYDTDGNPAPLSDLARRVHSSGFGVYTTFDFRDHFGVALDMDRVKATDDTSSQLAFQGGLRYMFFHRFGFTPYVRGSFGRGLYGYSNNAASVGYNLYGLAGGTDFRLSHSFNLRAEYEYQSWLSVPLRNPQPQIVKLGIAYRFHSDILSGRGRH